MSQRDQQELLDQAAALANKLDWAGAANLLKDAGDSTIVLDRRGWYLSRAKQYEDAKRIYEELIRREPTQFRHFYMAASQYYEGGEFERALPLFDRSVSLNSSHLKSWWRKAHSLHKLGREDEGAQAAARVLRLWHGLDASAKENGQAVAARASHLLARWQLRKSPWTAVELAQQAVDLDGRDAYHRYVLAMALLRSNRTADALVQFREARKLKPGDPSIEIGFAEALSRVGEREAALETIRRIEPRLQPVLAFKAGRLLHALGEERLARQLLERAQRDRQLRENQRLRLLLHEIQASIAAGSTAPNAATADALDGTSMGTIAVIRPERRFGFVVDDREGVRRHFRVKDGSTFAVGDRVRFRPYDADKGPAASDLEPIDKPASSRPVAS